MIKNNHGIYYLNWINNVAFTLNRWDTEAKANFAPSAFMPFGLGPRNCIGMQFAREEIKLILCTLIKQYQFFPVEETPVRIYPSNITYCYVVNKTFFSGENCIRRWFQRHNSICWIDDWNSLTCIKFTWYVPKD